MPSSPRPASATTCCRCPRPDGEPHRRAIQKCEGSSLQEGIRPDIATSQTTRTAHLAFTAANLREANAMICATSRRDGVKAMRLCLWAMLAALPLSMSSIANDSAGNSKTSLSISETKDNWELTVPVAHVTVVVPKRQLRVEKLAAGGAAASPRYFYLVDRTDGEAIFAGWLESSERVKNVDQLLQSTWTSEERALKAGGFEVQSIETGHVGDWATIAYAVSHASFKEHSAHIRASRVAGDTWVDLHLSVTKDASEEDCRKAVRELLQSVSIRLR